MSTLSLFRSNLAYRQPLKHRLNITSLDGTDLYFTSSPFEDTHDVNVVYLDAERATGETGTFNIVISDPDSIIAKDHLRNARVTIEFGKTLATLRPFMAGYCDIFQTRRPRFNYQEYLLNGPSTKIQLSELLLLIRQAADDPNNPNYGIANLVRDSITKRKWRPLNRQDIQEITAQQGGEWLVDLVSEGGGISDELNKIKYSVINEVFTTCWDFLERMAAITGADWDIDWINSDFDQKLTMGYPSTRGTGVNIKSVDLASTVDNVEKTSYLFNDFTIEDNASVDAGVATRLYTTTIVDQEVVSSQNTNKGGANLVDVARAQELIIENDQRRITDLMFIVSKVGAPESPKSRVNGDIVMDSGANQPTGRVLATFNFPLDDVKSTPTNIFVNDIDVKIRFLQGENKIWVRLFQRSGTTGDPIGDAANTIVWHHNGVFNTTQTVYTAFSTGPSKGDYKLKDTMTWSSSNQGPIFCYSIFSNIRRLQARSNPQQAKIIRWKEGFEDTSFINQVDENNLYLSRVLARRSKARRAIQNVQVTNPDNFLFKPYDVVNFSDSTSEEFQELAVARSRYVISALPGDAYPLGALYAELTLQGSFNPILGSCSCS